MLLEVDFAGEVARLDGTRPFLIGREGDLAIDDNPYLHRRFLELRFAHDIWWVVNVGSALGVTLADRLSGTQAWLPSSGRMPIVFPRTALIFSAGSTTYEIELHLAAAPYVSTDTTEHRDGSTTIGRFELTHDQHLLIVVLAEPTLIRNRPGAAELPTSAVAASRLGWTTTKFNRKLDNVCEKFERQGIRGLHGESGNLASSRRGRLVEYAIATRMVTATDLGLLDQRRANDEVE